MPTLGKIAALFLRLGATGFGGPIALIAMIESECGRRLQWFSQTEFQRAYLFCKLLPGPVAYQMSVWAGYHVRGRLGGFIAGLFFLIPSAVLILLLSVLYTRLDSLPQFSKAMEGMSVGALVVIFLSILQMVRPLSKSLLAWSYLLAAIVLMFAFPRWEPLIIIGSGIVNLLLARVRPIRTLNAFALPVLLALFWMHFKAAIFVFGTGLAIIPVLQHEVVDHYRWLDTQTFLDGIAFGQMTPGPVTITSVFIGHRVAGFSGALLSLAGMYLPGLLLVLGFLPWIRRKVEGKRSLQVFQEGAVPAVIGCLIAATGLLAKDSLASAASAVFQAGLFIMLLLMALRVKIPAWILIPLGGFVSVLL